MDALLFIYFYGCFIAFLGVLALHLFEFLHSKITGGDIYRQNIAKINVFVDPFEGRVVTREPVTPNYFRAVIIDSALSWLTVLFQIKALYDFTFGIFKDMATSSPQLKELFYPLRTNPNLEKEVVWARCFVASMIVIGQQPTEDDIWKDLQKFEASVPNFDTNKAIRHLVNLNAVNFLKKSS